MELKESDKDNFWNNHTLNDFQRLAILKNVHSSEIVSICFLKDGRIASSSEDKNILIFNKNTFKTEIRIKEKKRICYMNVNKGGILISCSNGTYVNLYEIKGKKYKIIQTIKPYSLLIDVIGKFDDSFSIQKFIELKNGDIAILVWGKAVSFYTKKKNSQKYSYLNKYREIDDDRITDLCEIEKNKYCVTLKFKYQIQFLDMNSKKVNETIKLKDFCFS